MVAGLLELLPLIGDAGIEDFLHALRDQPLDVTMRQLGRIALGLGRD